VKPALPAIGGDRTRADQTSARKGLVFERRSRTGRLRVRHGGVGEAHRLIGNEKARPSSARKVSKSKNWSQTATNIVTSNISMASRAPANGKIPSGSSSAASPTPSCVGRRGGYFADGSRATLSRTSSRTCSSNKRWLSTRPYGSTWRAAQAAVLGVLHQLRARQHGIDHGPDAHGRHAVQVGLRHGYELSTLRGSKETLSGGGLLLVPELHEGFDAFAGVIKSGGRRGARRRW